MSAQIFASCSATNFLSDNDYRQYCAVYLAEYQNFLQTKVIHSLNINTNLAASNRIANHCNILNIALCFFVPNVKPEASLLTQTGYSTLNVIL